MMTKEQEYLSQLEKEKTDYHNVLKLLNPNHGDMIYFGRGAILTLRKAVNADLACIDSEIRALKKKGGKNEQV
jgi:hypothetical protein